MVLVRCPRLDYAAVSSSSPYNRNLRLMRPRFGIYDGSDSGMTSYEKTAAGIVMFFGLAILLTIITSIVKFSKFRLTSLDYQRETIITVVLGVASIAFIFSALDIFGGIFVACQVFFAIWLMIYAIIIRRRVLKGMAEEMKRPTKDGNVNIELERGKTPVGQQPFYRVERPKNASETVSDPTRPSQSSLATSGELDAPAKEVREFV